MRFPLLTKVLAMLGVMLLLAWVLWRIESLVWERRNRQAQAQAGIEQSLAGAQTLLGPLLQRRCVEEWTTVNGEGKDRSTTTNVREMLLAAPPQSLDLDGKLSSEARYRGLFKLNGYTGPLTLQTQWAGLAALQPQREHAGSTLRCDRARLLLSVSDVRGLRAARVLVDGKALAVQPGTGHALHARGLHVELPNERSDQAEAPLQAVVSLELVGTSRLALVPAAGQTRMSLRGDWPHPSFGGRFLPHTRNVTPQGFTALWVVSELSSPAASDVLRPSEVCPVHAAAQDGRDDGEVAPPTPAVQGRVCLDTLAVSFIDPVNPYVQTDRATKYALLFIVLTFGAVAATEVLSRRSVHPVQYTLVGLALALFYLLLLGLSEHIAFGAAYAVASGGCVGLLGFYARHMLDSRTAGVAFGTGVALLYGVLWTLLQMEQMALVTGAVVLFAALATVMVLTRRVDWYGLTGSLRPAAKSG